ncbi:O-acyltransferase like protein-like [Biomphalaria glabrata]|uniref:O-acyltransferase like protein-like n=1 Tax=Biomphalaria glabrata TaxID=6526 RepID=A0A9W2YB90_BIOGL|nr:O-acyltransferase like protein-like [Biomphalaria glabrata]XP_055859973.1 O-acyltransferase like protein-like [Biomphalaria glabrata]XP_055859975.1 O-acyltransferase like protein-like [Biomphalaria glabrata]XP_055859976.1 O-acyltransferase like protein-like [Biomphalaria glabrata]XP_055859977.1 O-acyltransferase like protein-like [Biomphalaria glabrata]
MLRRLRVFFPFLVFYVLLEEKAIGLIPDVSKLDLGDLPGRLEDHHSVSYLLLPHIYRAFLHSESADWLAGNSSVSVACRSTLSQYYAGLLNKETWAWKMYDSMGKQSSGVLFGATTWTGNYEECFNVRSTTCQGDCHNKNLSPHFCSVHMTQAPWLSKLVSNLQLPFPVPSSPFIVDVCVPTNCSKQDITTIVTEFLRLENSSLENTTASIQVKSVLCHERGDVLIDTPAIICIFILCTILLMVILGTSYDINKRRKKLRVKHGPEITIGYENNTDSFGILRILVTPRRKSRRRGTLSSSETLEHDKTKNANTDKTVTLVNKVPVEDNHKSILGTSPLHSDLQDIPEDIEMRETTDLVPHTNLHSEESVPDEDANSVTSSNMEIPPTPIERKSVSLTPRINRQHSIIEVRPSHRSKKLTSSENILTDFLLSFSFRKNTRHILADGSADTLFCLNGIRVLSIAWIVLGNVYGTMFWNPDIVDNYLSAVKMTQTLWMQMVINTTLAADSFFVLSGTLGAYNFLKIKTKAGKHKQTDWRKIMSLKEYFFMIVHRLIRIFPCYAVLLMLGTNLMPFMGDGPRWSHEIENVKICKKNWWTNVLFINNLYDPDNMCLPHTYYLANDFQFFIMAPLVMIPLLIKPRLGFALIGMFLTLQIVVVSVLNEGINGNVLKLRLNEYWSLIYVKPYSRIGVYCIGLGLGYLLFNCDRQMKFRKMFLYCGWIVSCVILFLLPYITYLENREGGQQWTGTQTAIYEAFSRPAWALALSWVIFCCSTGQGAFVGKFLSWNVFLPLCRITYGVFLLHPILIHVVIESAHNNFYLNLGELVYTYIALFVCSYGLAFLLISCVECPFVAFESHIRLRFKKWMSERKLHNLLE